MKDFNVDIQNFKKLTEALKASPRKRFKAFYFLRTELDCV